MNDYNPFDTPAWQEACRDYQAEAARRADPPRGTSTRAPLRVVKTEAVGMDDIPFAPYDAEPAGEVAAIRDNMGEAKGGGRVDAIAKALRPLGELKAELRNTYLVKGWIDQGAASTIYGESNVGKTFLALDMGLHVAAGADWHGNRVAQGLVIYAAAEGGRGIVNRLEAFKKDKPELAKAAADRFMLLPLTLDLCAPGDAQAFVDALGDLRPALVVVDTLARSMGAGDENTAKDMGQFIANVDFIRAETGAHVLVIHHSGKDTTRGARGSGALRGAVDTEIELTRADSVITATTRKQRDMPGDAAFNYTLRSVFLGYDEDGDAVTSCVVEPTEAAPPKPEETKRRGQEKPNVAMQALSEALIESGKVISGPNYPTCPVVTMDAWRTMCGRHGLTSSDNPESLKKAVDRQCATLMAKGLIRKFDGHVWKVKADE